MSISSKLLEFEDKSIQSSWHSWGGVGSRGSRSPFCPQPRPLSFKSRASLGPIAQFKIARIVPYRLILHVVLVLSATYSCVVFNSIHGIDSRAVGANFERSFFPQDWREFAGDDADFPQQPYVLYTVSGFITSVTTISSNYFGLATRGLSVYGVYPPVGPNAPSEPPSVTVIRYSDVKGMYDESVLRLEYAWPIHHLDPNVDQNVLELHTCQRLVLNTVYDLSSGPVVNVLHSLDIVGQCGTDKESVLLVSATTGQALIIALAMIYEVFAWRELLAQFRVMRKLATVRPIAPVVTSSGIDTSMPTDPIQRSTRRSLQRVHLTLGQRCEVLNLWLPVSTVGNLLLLLYCCVAFRFGVAYSTLRYSRIALALGTSLLWLSGMQFFAFTAGLYLVPRMFMSAGVIMATVMISVLPMFLGYALFGLVVFGQYSARFVSFPRTVIAMFAFVNGDGIDEFFNHIEVPNGTLFTLFTNLYAYTFVLLLTYFSLNVLIAINEEAVFDTRREASSRFSPEVSDLLAQLEAQDPEMW